MAAFSIRNVVKTFETREAGEVCALDEVSFDSVPDGITCIVGPTGSGKSTLLRIMAGLERPDRGEALVAGRKPSELTGQIGYLAQGHSLFPWMTVSENIALPLAIRDRSGNGQVTRVKSLCTLLGLSGSENRYPYELSGGMQQRVSLGRLLATASRYWLMDEPFSSLDEHSRQHLRRLLLRLVAESRLSVLFVTHSIDEAIFLADRVVVLTAAPGRTVRIFDVPLGHPRNRISPEYGRLVEQVRMSIETIL